MDWRERVNVNPAICHGQACIKGTRVMVAVVLDNFAAGLNTDEILRSYPSLTTEDLQAAMAYAADLARQRTVPLPTGTVTDADSGSESANSPFPAPAPRPSVLSLASALCLPAAAVLGAAAAALRSQFTLNGDKIASAGYCTFLCVVLLGTILGVVALWAVRGVPEARRSRRLAIFGALQFPMILTVVAFFAVLWASAANR